MKILYHHRTLGDGAEGIHIREMVKSFRSLGHQVMGLASLSERLWPDLRHGHGLCGI